MLLVLLLLLAALRAFVLFRQVDKIRRGSGMAYPPLVREEDVLILLKVG